MATRPAFLDLRSKSHDPQSGALPSPRPLLSPRLHVPGDIPPDLSPLDAFAAHSRALAKQLEEETTKDGSRLSRLPSLTIANKLNTSRPGYFRSASTVESTAGAETSPISGEALALLTEIEAPGFRPVSHYPRMSGIEETPPFESPVPPSRSEARPEARPEPHDDEERYRGRKPITLTDGPGYFGARREESPGVLQRENRSPRQGNSPRQLHHTPSADSLRRRGHTPRRPQDGSLATVGYDSRALAPPRSPMFAQRTPSPGSASMTSDYDEHSSLHNSNGQQNRKLSSGSQFSTTSPISPVMYSEARSPSISSEISVGGGVRLPRPAFNFSRPLSSQSLPPVELPSRQASEDSQPSFVLADDTAHTPVSMHSDGFPDTTSENGGAPSYVYSRFSLPRGKMLQRNSLIFQPELPNAQFQWEQPVPYSNVQTLNGGSIQAPPSPPSRPSTSSRADSTSSVPSQTRPSLDPGRPSFDPSRPSYERGRSTDGRGRPSTEQSHPMSRFVESSSSSISPSTNSDSTIKGAMSTHSLTPSAEQSAEEHVAKAIECHEAGALKESTYHLRLAARQNHPTGMLLYALACRHGWGMRPNQREGVAWLKKAADCASLEVADDEDLVKDGKAVDVLEKKTRKAQFALSIYELGVSHMNGWGIEQDKVLALRCFEIAGSWGDADALAEAGFCYAQGVGCKKDLKRSAKFYRQAEAKGISMIGNSWIYKAKYNDDEEEDKRAVGSPEKKGRSKSRTRWGRMKSHN